MRLAMLDGACDLHVHCAPDVRERRTTALELARAARDAGMSALLLKNHEFSTVALAATVSEALDGFPVFGGIVLNEAVGSLNVTAVEIALRMGAKEVWMPTHCACHERTFRGRPGTGISILDAQGKVLPDVQEICRLVAAHNAVLGTAHLSPREIHALVRTAREHHVRTVIITHPEITFLNLSIDFQKELAGPDILFERCFVRPLFALDWDGLAASIRAVGIDTTMLATDLGQPENPHPVAGLAEMRAQLSQRGFTISELDLMLRLNALKALAL
ncbi:MAG: DUF6282 family protein [Bryobacteraceae bacterium]|nr:DUF6282 family protein [Bryobacteraceae bacterium]